MAGIDRGLTMDNMRNMTIGEIVDYCVEYNNRQYEAEKQEEKQAKRGRKATQKDWDNFLG